MDGSDKDGVAADTVHVDTCTSLQVIQVDISKFGDKIDDIILCTGLLKKNRMNDPLHYLFKTNAKILTRKLLQILVNNNQ